MSGLKIIYLVHKLTEAGWTVVKATDTEESANRIASRLFDKDPDRKLYAVTPVEMEVL